MTQITRLTINNKLNEAHAIINKLTEPPHNVGMDCETEDLLQQLQIILTEVSEMQNDRTNKARELLGIAAIVLE